jgi:hypothetical protein
MKMAETSSRGPLELVSAIFGPIVFGPFEYSTQTAKVHYSVHSDSAHSNSAKRSTTLFPKPHFACVCLTLSRQWSAHRIVLFFLDAYQLQMYSFKNSDTCFEQKKLQRTTNFGEQRAHFFVCLPTDDQAKNRLKIWKCNILYLHNTQQVCIFWGSHNRTCTTHSKIRMGNRREKGNKEKMHRTYYYMQFCHIYTYFDGKGVSVT